MSNLTVNISKTVGLKFYAKQICTISGFSGSKYNFEFQRALLNCLIIFLCLCGFIALAVEIISIDRCANILSTSVCT